jgi:tetratricopeptide (TPR) repeat protein
MTVKANHLLLSISFALLHFSAIAQIVFPTEADHARNVDSFTNVLKTAKDDTNKVKTLLAFGEELLYWSDEEKPKSLSYLKQALSLSEKLHSTHQQIESLLLLSAYSKGSQDFTNAVKYIKEAMTVAENMKDYTKLSRCYNFLAGTYMEQGRNDDAMKSFNSSLDMAFRSDTKEALLGSYYGLAMFYLNKDKPGYPESIRYFLMVLKLAEETNDIETIQTALNNIGTMYSQMEDYEQSIYYYEQIIEKTGTVPFLSNLLIAYRGSKDYKKGINTINYFNEKNEKSGDKRLIAYGLDNLGSFYEYVAEELYQNKGNFDSINYYLDKALISFKKSEKIENEENIKNIPSRAFDQGKTYALKVKLIQTKPNRTDTVKKYLDLALANFLQHLNKVRNSGFLTAAALVHIGELLGIQAKQEAPSARTKTNAEALRYLDTAILVGMNDRVTKTIGPSLEPVMDAYRLKSDIYKSLGQYDKSFDALKHYDEVKDSITTQQTRQKNEQMRIASAIILGTTEEKARYENTIKDIRSNFLKKEDSLAFQRTLADERFNQKQKEFQLQRAELTLANNQKELNLFKFLKTQTELENELFKREEKEKALTIADKEKSLQRTQLNLQKTQLDLKESQIEAQNRQRLFLLGSIVLLALVFVFVFRDIKNKQRLERLVATERLRSEKILASHQMTELELQSLRAQLNPHFMFNSLNAIQELILKEDTENSHLYLSRFADLLRMLLDNANQAFVTLKKEISLLELYLSLENLRIPDLNYSIEIDSLINTNNTRIPNMILQPYIENAIWHGLSHKNGERKLSIRITRQENNMVCQIEDNGVGRQKSAELKSLYRKEHRSKGMQLLSRRFNLISKEYGSAIEISIEDLKENDHAIGTIVSINVPMSLAEQVEARLIHGSETTDL